MKKHDEGYVLAYVMVIVAVLLLIALSVMSVSLTNIQRQRADIERMQDKYAAEGAVERAMETLEGINTLEILDHIAFADAQVSIREGSVEGTECVVVITAKHGAVQIDAEVQVLCEQMTPAQSGSGYAVMNPKVQKTLSYKITTAEGGGGQ